MQNKKEPMVLLADDDSSSEDDQPQSNAKLTPANDDDDQSTSSSIDQADGDTNTNDTIEPAFISDGKYRNKQRCLVICSRGVTPRFRHLLEDLKTLIPHHKKESKLDASKNDKGGIGAAVNDIAEIRGCNSVLFLECRKRQDAYLWLGHTNRSKGSASNGPSAKFLIENIHTMDELRLTGNCMRGSRPILTFDTGFDNDAKPELQLLKSLLVDVFGTPRGHPKSKPFVDRIMGFYYADGKVRLFS
jgi:ribosome biogenesis protein BRX1